MQKRLLAAAVAAMITLSTGIAMANPVQLDGSASYQFRQDKVDGVKDNGSKYTFILNAKTNVEKNLDVYARLGAQGTTVESFADFTTGSNFAANVDQYGLDYSNAGVEYKLGRQDATVGATALLYNNNFMVGKNAFVDGLTVSGKSGATDLKAIAVQEDNANDNRLYALSASYSPAQNWLVGATLAKYDNKETDVTTNHYALNAAYTTGKAIIFGEYAKSDADDQNKAYDLGVSYNLDSKNAIGVGYVKVEGNGDIGGKTDFDNNEKGMHYSFNHKVNDNSSVAVTYKANTTLNTNVDKSSLRATVNYNF